MKRINCFYWTGCYLCILSTSIYLQIYIYISILSVARTHSTYKPRLILGLTIYIQEYVTQIVLCDLFLDIYYYYTLVLHIKNVIVIYCSYFCRVYSYSDSLKLKIYLNVFNINQIFTFLNGFPHNDNLAHGMHQRRSEFTQKEV